MSEYGRAVNSSLKRENPLNPFDYHIFEHVLRKEARRRGKARAKRRLLKRLAEQ